MLSDQNDAEVLRRIGTCYHNLKDREKAFEWFAKSSELGNARAQRCVGIYYEKGYFVAQNYEKAVEWYTKAAEQGDAVGQCNLGYCYYKGIGVKQSYEKANEWYTKAAEQGNARAQGNLGYNYEYGQGVEIDKEKAVEWYTKAAEQGNLSAEYNLGSCYYHGKGVEVNYDKAIEWFSKKELNGDNDAENFLGCCYDCKKEFEKAAEWYTKSAEHGNMYAQKNLGFYYQNGTGVEKDYEKAAELFKKAAEQGYEDAKNALDELYDLGLVAREDAPKVQDDVFGELVHYGDNLWKAKTTANFYGKDSQLTIELEGYDDDEVTDEQRKAYAEYQTKADALLEAVGTKVKQLFNEEGNVVPKRLFIDQEGNYGWVCATTWNNGMVAAILSDGEVKLESENSLYNYADVVEDRDNTSLEEGDTINMDLFGEVEVKKSKLKGTVGMEWVDEGKLELLLNEKNEVTEAQKTAFIKYINKPEAYYTQVRECLFKEFLYDYESFNSRTVIEETDGNHIKHVTADSLRGYYRYDSLVIDAEGNLGFVFDCSWTEDQHVAVFFSEEGPVALTPETLHNIKQAKDPDFGFMLHGKFENNRILTWRAGRTFKNITYDKAWIGLIPNEFYAKDPYMHVRVQCEADQQITPEQRKAFAEYLKNKDKHYADLQQLAKEVTEGTRGEDDVVVPKVLFIDRQGNYGWLVYVPWNEHFRGVMLSDGELFFTKPGVFHNYHTYLDFKAKTEFELGDNIFFELCKELISVRLGAGGDNAFDESGNYRTDNTLTEEEKDLLKWVLENRNLDHMADDLVEEANDRFSDWTEKEIETIDLLEEMQLSTLHINIDDDGEPEYDVTISGNANWDGEAGVAITSSDREFDGVTGESYVL